MIPASWNPGSFSDESRRFCPDLSLFVKSRGVDSGVVVCLKSTLILDERASLLITFKLKNCTMSSLARVPKAVFWE